MKEKPYLRSPDAVRIAFHGIDTVHPPDQMPPGRYPYAQNVRAYLKDATTGRATQDTPAETLPFSVYSVRRLNDTTPAGPFNGFILVSAAGGNLFAGTTSVASGMSGNPVSMIPFRPNASVQPWMYVGDSIYQEMLKVRSDGLCYLMGVAEPQAPPTISSVPASNQVSLLGSVTVTYWGDSPHSGPTGNYIWKNAGDTGGAGPIRSSTAPNGVTTGNSLIFDTPTPGSQGTPMQWTQYNTYQGTVTTNGFNVTWDSGSQFDGLGPPDTIMINGLSYGIATVPDNTHMTLSTSAGVQTNVNYTAAVPGAATPLFQPALESEGYSDFNFCLEATLYIPVAGTYTFTLASKDDAMWGIGSSGLGTATWAPPSGGQALSINGQTRTALNGYRLMPRTFTPDGGGATVTGSVDVTFSQAGNYPLEVDYDFWYHTPRHLSVQCEGINIPPIPGTAITQASYRYTYRGSATGATSNPSPPSPVQTLAVQANTLVAVPSPDPQVDKIDWYRMDTGLLNFTYVGTGPNSTAPFVDNLLDADVAANPTLEFDNFQPFPSIDLPKAGVVNVSGGIATWVSGDQFNIRWLPGTIIIVGTVAYTLDKRPTSNTQLTASNVELVNGVEITVPIADGLNQVYEIAEPILAAQPLPYLFGPTDNVSFFFGVGDPLRPGTLYWSKGNNPDSAPDTNQQDVTSPSEPLMNGVIVNGIGFVMSSERGFLIYPNFFNALATATGTEGSQWTIQESVSTRGLYMPRCICVDGGGNVFFRAKDGIYIAPGGLGAKSITDEDLFNIFPHEGFVPQPVTRGGFTVYPPDDTQPQKQQLNVANGYLYYDYAIAGAVSTTTTEAITVTGQQDVTTSNQTNLQVDQQLLVDPGPNQERVTVTNLVFEGVLHIPVGFGAVFTKTHPANVVVETIPPTQQTLVFDLAAKGWVPDVYQYPTNVHYWEEGMVNEVLVGCSDGTIRPLTNSGAEVCESVVLMPCANEGDTRAQKHFGDLYVEAGTE